MKVNIPSLKIPALKIPALKIPTFRIPEMAHIFILYFLFVATLAHLIWLTTSGDFSAVVFLICLGYLLSTFSKNMMVVLAIVLVATHFFIFAQKKDDVVDGKYSKF